MAGVVGTEAAGVDTGPESGPELFRRDRSRYMARLTDADVPNPESRKGHPSPGVAQ